MPGPIGKDDQLWDVFWSRECLGAGLYWLGTVAKGMTSNESIEFLSTRDKNNVKKRNRRASGIIAKTKNIPGLT